MNNSEFIPYAKQHITIEDIDAVAHSLKQQTITRGPYVEAFEKAVASYVQADYAVAFSNASTALLAAYRVVNTAKGDQILTTPNSFISTISGGLNCGADVVFVDIDSSTGNLNVNQLKMNMNRPSLNRKTVIVPVHFAGIPVDVEEIGRTIANLNTVVIEDAAHAIGSRYKDGQMIGCCAWSDMTIFSFHPAKTMTTGEGGMVTTNDVNLYKKLKNFRNNCIERDPEYLQNQPAPGYYEVTGLSSNYNFTEMQAALGLSQLKRVDAFIKKRQQLLGLYKASLKHLKHVRLLNYTHETAPHICVVCIDFQAYRVTKSQVMDALHHLNIGTQVHYIPLYRHPVLSNVLGDISEYFPEMEKYYAEALSLPLYYELEEKQVAMIVNCLKKSLKVI